MLEEKKKACDEVDLKVSIESFMIDWHEVVTKIKEIDYGSFSSVASSFKAIPF